MSSSTPSTRIIFLGAHHPHFYVRTTILRDRGDVDIVGFWEQDEVLAKKIEQRTGVRRFDSEHDLLKVGFDVAFIHPLDHDNPRLARLAASAGAKGLLLEKPGATKPEYIFQLAEDLANWRGVWLGDALLRSHGHCP